MVPPLSTLLLIALLTVATAQYCLYSDGTSIAGSAENGLCNCYSGYYSSLGGLSNCFDKAPPSCTFNPAPTQLSTDYVPFLDEGASRVFENHLMLVVRSPLVESRLGTQLSLQGGNPFFSYPSKVWQKVVENCQDTFILTLPLEHATSAGFERHEDSTYYYLSSVLVVEYFDQIGELRGMPITRTTQSILRIEVRSPKKITVTSHVEVIYSFGLQAAITYQAYDPTTNKGIIEYTTAVPYPFRLAGIEDIVAPSPLTGTAAELQNITCGSAVSSDCIQKFKMYIEPNGACRLNGLYDITVSFDCRNVQCPRLGLGSIISQLASEDFCSIIRLDIDLFGSMGVYRDSSFTQQGDKFLPGQDPVFLATVGSTRATIESSSLIEIFYSMSDGSSKTLLSQGAATTLAQANDFVLTNINATANWFSVSVTVGNGGFDLFSLPSLDPTFVPSVPPSPSVEPQVESPIASPEPFSALDPILECVEQVDEATYIAHFGYQNNGATVSLEIGPQNGFNGAGHIDADLGQPITFSTRRTRYFPANLFSVTWSGEEDLIWSLNGVNRTAQANDLSVRCPATLDFMFILNTTTAMTAAQYTNFHSALAEAMLIGQEQLLTVNAKTDESVMIYTFRIDAPTNSSTGAGAKQALLNLLALKDNSTRMQLIVDPFNQRLGIRFLGILLTSTGVETQRDTSSNTLLPAKRTTSQLAVQNKRAIEQDVTGRVQFFAVVEVTWQGLVNNQKRRFQMQLSQNEQVASGKQSKKFSAGIDIDASSISAPIGNGARTNDARSDFKVPSLMIIASLFGVILL